MMRQGLTHFCNAHNLQNGYKQTEVMIMLYINVVLFMYVHLRINYLLTVPLPAWDVMNVIIILLKDLCTIG